MAFPKIGDRVYFIKKGILVSYEQICEITNKSYKTTSNSLTFNYLDGTFNVLDYGSWQPTSAVLATPEIDRQWEIDKKNN
jgi:hypothetical protein